MRLTLRNLLRFLDQTNLGPLERERLQELVEHSDRAESWIDRIRTLRADPGKPAPPIDGQPAVTRVAQYLDGALSEQETVSFEETMLGSDEILAEVASSHLIVQRLSDAETPAISVVLRQTLYDLDRVFAKSARGSAAESADHVDAVTSMEDLPFLDAGEPDPDSDSLVTETDDSLDESTGQAKPVSLDSMTRRASGRNLLLAGLVVALLVGAFGFTYWLGRESVRLGQPARVTDPDAKPAVPSPADNPPGDSPDTADTATDPDQPDSPPGDESDSDAVDDPSSDVADVDPDPSPVLLVDQPRPPAADAVAPQPADTDLPPRPNISLSGSADGEIAPVSGPTMPPRVVARAAEPQILALMKSGDDSPWTAINRSVDLREGDRIRVLAGMVAEFELGDQLKLVAVGPATFALGVRDPDSGADEVQLEFGMIAVESASSDMDWTLRIGDDEFRISMLLANSGVHAQARPYLPPGIDPRQVEPAVVKSIHTVDGRCRVESGEQSWDLPNRNALVSVSSPIPEIAAAPRTGMVQERVEIPRYVQRLTDIVGHNLRSWQAMERDVTGELLDLKGDSRQEVRLAAVSWLAEGGNFDFVIDFMGDPSNKANWRTFLQALRHTIQNNPEYADKLFEGLGYAGPENQARLYGLFLGFGQEDLESGLDARLVEDLNDSSLAVRVLAIENLRQITGGVTYGYLPTKSRTLRKRIVVRQWEPRLKKGGIRYSAPPELPIMKLSSMPAPANENAPAAGLPSDEGSGDSGG